jgi:RND family efflux transporter MFP subunit
MKTIMQIRRFLVSSAGWATSVSVVALGAAAIGAMVFVSGTQSLEASGGGATGVQTDVTGLVTTSGQAASASPQRLRVPQDKLDSIGIQTEPARRDVWPERLRLTGRLELNESRIAHVSSLVDGVVREVKVEIGQAVEAGDVLAYVDSRQVGEAKLQLVRDQLQLRSAKRTCDWLETIHRNTSALLDTLEDERALEEIEAAFEDRPVGTYREQLVSALARLKQAEADFARARSLGQRDVIPEKQVIRARAEHEAAAAGYRALNEQIRFDAQQQALEAQQELQAAEAAVAISRSRLLILGYSREDIDRMDPIAEAERVAYYPVRSPIAGTVIAKHAPLSKHVDAQTELVEIADLSTVWLRADVFEKDLEAVAGLEGRSVSFASGSYPRREFTAEVFSTGSLVDDETRAARLLAIADNRERLLKPGMFVEIELSPPNDGQVLQVPSPAVQRHDGTTFVFVSPGSGQFEARDVKLGRSTSETVEIAGGLDEGEPVVVQGGFALKSQMLSDLMAEE